MAAHPVSPVNIMATMDRETNCAGVAYLFPCAFCGADFGGKEMWRRHRLSRSERYPQREERCLDPEQMMEKGWYLDRYGRWRDTRGRKRS